MELLATLHLLINVRNRAEFGTTSMTWDLPENVGSIL